MHNYYVTKRPIPLAADVIIDNYLLFEKYKAQTSNHVIKSGPMHSVHFFCELVLSSPLSLSLSPSAPSIPSLQIIRFSNTSIELIVNLAYTGGGDITVLDVSFQEIGTEEWIMIGSHDALSMSEMTWKALISDERFIGIGVEFQVTVRNTHGHLSQTVELIEPLGNNMVVSCMVKGRHTSLKHKG